MKALIIPIIFLLYGCSSNRLIKQKYSVDEIKKEIDYFLQETVDFNGSILVNIEGNSVLRKNYGYTDANKTNLINNNSKYNIGSICKEFTAMAIVKLIEDRKINFGTKISEILIKLPEWSKLITIKDLLFYTSGLPDIRFRNSLNDEAVKEDLTQIESLLFAPGSNYYYSNLNNYLQAKIVEEISQKSLSKYVEENFFQPLKMKKTTFTSNPPKNEKNTVKSYSKEHGGDIEGNPNFKNFELCYAPVYMTTDDLNKWMQYIQIKYDVRHNESEALYEETAEQRVGPLGLIHKENNLIIKHEHLGQAYNFESLMARDYTSKITIILMTNNRKRDQLKDIEQKVLGSIKRNQIGEI